MILQQALKQSHEYARRIVQPGDTVVDATMGNGHDTAFLASLTGREGKVYAFDIQKEAIENTKKRLLNEGLSETCILIQDGHEKLGQYVHEPVKLVLFNLGYRPGGDHTLCTLGETTLQAVQAAFAKLTVCGMIILVIYHGGDSGFEERDYLLERLPQFDPQFAAVMVTQFVNLPNHPPILVCIEKLK
ncbi:MAG: methyltransferase domain-containing protein [Clostridiaceae bacterium]|nr:methyltransferase domain-containing protein [Clostridiaceae bacterium]